MRSVISNNFRRPADHPDIPAADSLAVYPELRDNALVAVAAAVDHPAAIRLVAIPLAEEAGRNPAMVLRNHCLGKEAVGIRHLRLRTAEDNLEEEEEGVDVLHDEHVEDAESAESAEGVDDDPGAAVDELASENERYQGNLLHRRRCHHHHHHHSSESESNSTPAKLGAALDTSYEPILDCTIHREQQAEE